MKLDNDGRKKLEAMKKALAAGVPLAGLLTAAACSPSGGGLFTVQGRVPDREREAQLMEQQTTECAPPAAEGEAAEEIVTLGEMVAPEAEPETEEVVTMGKPAPERIKPLMERQAAKCAPPEEEAVEEMVTMGEPAVYPAEREPLPEEEPDEFVLGGEIAVSDELLPPIPDAPVPPPDGDEP